MATSEAAVELASRVAVLEVKVKQLQQKLEAVVPDATPWWEHIVGAFADDPSFEEAMRLGREYRESLRPKSRSRQTRRVQSVKARKR